MPSSLSSPEGRLEGRYHPKKDRDAPTYAPPPSVWWNDE